MELDYITSVSSKCVSRCHWGNLVYLRSIENIHKKGKNCYLFVSLSLIENKQILDSIKSDTRLLILVIHK